MARRYANALFGGVMGFAGGAVTLPPVQAPSPTLGALTLSDGSYRTGTPESGTINGATAGSVITTLAALPAGFTINSAARTWAWDGTGSVSTPTVTFVETLGIATNSGRQSAVSLTIADPVVTALVASPYISGEAIVGGTLWADDGLDDPATTYARRWLSGVTDVAADMAPLSGQTAASLTVPPIGGDYVRLEVTPANGEPVRYSDAVRIHYATMTAPVLLRTSTSGGSPFTYTVALDNTVFADGIERVQYSTTFTFDPGTILWDATRGLTEAAFAPPYTPDETVDADPAWDNPPPTFTGTYYVRRKVIALSGIVESYWSNVESNFVLDLAVRIDPTSAWVGPGSPALDRYTFADSNLTFIAKTLNPRIHAGRVNYARAGDRTAELVFNTADGGSYAGPYTGFGFDDGVFDWSTSTDASLKQINQNGWKGFCVTHMGNGRQWFKGDGTTTTAGPELVGGLGGWTAGDVMRIRYIPGTFTGSFPDNNGTAYAWRIRAGVMELMLTVTGIVSLPSAKIFFFGQNGSSATFRFSGLDAAFPLDSGSQEYQT